MGEIVHDSIIENKERTKSYWEQLMLAANSPSSSPEIKQSNNQSPSSQINHQAMNNLRLNNSEPTGGPKIVETVTKSNLLENNSINVTLTLPKKGSVIDREIQMQKEREAAFAQEREEALQKANKSVNSETRVPSDQEETLNYSIPTTDDGNFSEYGSEEKEEHSLDESRMMGLSPEMTVMRSGRHRRTQSMDSMSSGHSSGSIGSAGSGLPAAESCVRRRVVTVRPLDQPEEENLLAFARNEKETPIEREIRLSKEREEELRREKQLSPCSDIMKTRSKSLTCDAITAKPLSEDSRPAQIILPHNKGCIKKVFYITHSKSVSNLLDREPESPKLVTLNNSLPVSPTSPVNPSPSPSAKGAVPKLFSRNPNQKGLMKRFIASRGKLNSTFSFSSPPATTASNGQSNSRGLATFSPAKVQNWNISSKKEKSAVQVGTRPGYVSAEDKIQVELQEMRKREQELKEQRARTFIRSQPDLLSLLNEENEEEKHQVLPLKLRSALSNPNLLDMDDNLKSPSNDSKQPIKRSSLIDVWEKMIQKK